jgi:cystathionine gamma-lyase
MKPNEAKQETSRVIDDLRFETRAIHVGQAADEATGATIVPVYQTATFTQDAIGSHRGYEYSRSGNPTRDALEAALASLEEGRFGFGYASGMAAISGVTQLLSAGDHVVVCDDLYGGSYRLFTTVMPRYGVRFTFVDATQPENIEKAIESSTKMLWMESPTNPMLRLIDLAACGEIAQRHRLQLVVDNTFATPYLQNPLRLGAHVVVHSTTKYIGGHSDVIGGAVVVEDEETANRLQVARNATGGVPGPWDAWLTLRGTKTLALRMREHQANAMKVAEFLTQRPEVARVYYPGLADHPGHDLARSQMRGFGGIVTIDLAGGDSAARVFCESTEYFALGESLGGVESLIGYPWTMSHGAFAPEEKLSKGISEATVRLSVGIEHADDLCDDLAQALKRAAEAP